MLFTVLYEDNHLLVVNKPANLLVQGDATGDVSLVELCKEYVKKKYNKPGAVFMGLVHRIDRPVSGVVALTRTSKALERMTALFRERETKKTYWALVRRKPSQDQAHWCTGCRRMKRKTKQRPTYVKPWARYGRS